MDQLPSRYPAGGRSSYQTDHLLKQSHHSHTKQATIFGSGEPQKRRKQSRTWCFKQTPNTTDNSNRDMYIQERQLGLSPNLPNGPGANPYLRYPQPVSDSIFQWTSSSMAEGSCSGPARRGRCCRVLQLPTSHHLGDGERRGNHPWRSQVLQESRPGIRTRRGLSSVSMLSTTAPGGELLTIVQDCASITSVLASRVCYTFTALTCVAVVKTHGTRIWPAITASTVRPVAIVTGGCKLDCHIAIAITTLRSLVVAVGSR